MLTVRQVLLSSLTIFAANQIHATPTIAGYEGELIEGQTITITGNKFSSADAVPLVWDTVDNQAASTKINTVVPVSSNLTWSDNGSTWASPVRFSDANTKPGRESTYFGEGKSYLKWPNAVKDKNLKNIFVSWWFWLSEDPLANRGSNKFIRIWDNTSGKNTRISWTSMHFEATNSKTSWTPTHGNPGEWNRFDIWVSADTHTINAWVNNKLLHNLTDFNKANIETGFNVYLIGWDPSESSNYPDFKFYMSDIYISPSIARVEISDKKNWDDISATREIQLIRSWEDNQIKFNLNPGSFNTLTGKYLYVVDSSGSVNTTGFPLCDKCPQPPILGIE